MTWRNSSDFAKDTGFTARFLRGMVRRMVVTLADGVAWQLLGQRGGAGGDEVVEAETFPGIGFYASPGSGTAPEVILAAIGGTKSSVVIASRDQAALAAAQSDARYAAGDAMLYTPSAVVILRASTGQLELRSRGGAAAPLATLADVQALQAKLNGLIAAYNTHTHVVPSVSGVTTGGGVSGSGIAAVTLATMSPAAAPVGTVKTIAE